MSSAKQRQVAITATWKNGKDGYIAAIDESALNYASDPSMSPAEFGELSAKQAVANYGGYFKAHKGFTSEYVLGFANVIAKKYEELDKQLSSDADTIMGVLSDLDSRLTAENENKARQALYMGDTTDALAKRLNTLSDDLSVAASVANTPKAQFLIRESIAKLEKLLPTSGEVVETTERVLIA
ncbi:MAG: hypothetical protein ACO3FO_04690 [Candidatus Nanopelagicaceae bacterium]